MIVLGREGWVLSQLAQPAEAEEVDPLVMKSESARDYYRRVLTHMIFTQMSKSISVYRVLRRDHSHPNDRGI